MSAPPLAIVFSREELVVLADLCEVALPMLGDRPFAGMSAEAREAVLDAASRSLLARGVLVRAGDKVGVVRAAAGLVEILAASSLRAQVIVERDGERRRRTVHALPHAAVDATIDHNGNHRLAPFATEDLLVHIGGVTGLLPGANADADAAATADTGDGAGGEVSLPYGAWRGAQDALRDGHPGDAANALVDAGLAGATAELLLDVLRATTQHAAVQIIHHPSPSTSAGGEVAWVDAGDLGTWIVPTVAQPFAQLRRPGQDDELPAAEDGPALGAGTPELDAVMVTIARTTKAAILADLHSVLPAAG